MHDLGLLHLNTICHSESLALNVFESCWQIGLILWNFYSMEHRKTLCFSLVRPIFELSTFLTIVCGSLQSKTLQNLFSFCRPQIIMIPIDVIFLSFNECVSLWFLYVYAYYTNLSMVSHILLLAQCIYCLENSTLDLKILWSKTYT